MKKILLAAATATIGLLSVAPMAMAQAAPSREACDPVQTSCKRPLTPGSEQGSRSDGKNRQDNQGRGDTRKQQPGQQVQNQNGQPPMGQPPKGQPGMGQPGNGPRQHGRDQFAQNQQGQNQQGQYRKGSNQQGQSASGKSHAAPKIGASGRQGQPFQRQADSRFAAPPRGQDYRVVNDHLVLVDKNTLKIVTVIGLLSTLMN